MQNKGFIANLEHFGIVFDEQQYNSLLDLMRLTLAKNEVLNLTTITDEESFLNKMILDSALAFKDVNLTNKKTCIDVGTGGGFPGLVLAILYPTINFVLLDSTLKKCKHVEETAHNLNLNNVKVINDRVENFVIKNRGKFDLVTARAVSALNMLIELCSPLLSKNGVFVALKGKAGLDELNASKNAFKTLNVKLDSSYSYDLMDGAGTRINFHIVLNGVVPNKYPRSYNTIKNKPL